MSDFNPSRLVLARKRRGMTKKALAKGCGISTRSLTAYESGTQEPGAMNLGRLAEAVQFPVEFLSRPTLDEPPLEGSSFRALTRMTATKRDQALAAGALALELALWIDERFHLPDSTGFPRYRGIDPETAAEAVRDEWGLGERPIRNMIHLLEVRGVRVFSLAEETRDVDAFSFWADGVPYIFLNTMKSAEHSRMDGAHELGHLVLHSAHDSPRGRDEELEANHFGRAFLMPRSSVIAEAPQSGRVKDLIRAKRKWDVALSNLVYRMHSLDPPLLTDWQYRSLFREMSSNGYRTHEPNGIARETSQVLAKVFDALQQEGISQVDLARELCIPLADLQKIIFHLALTPIEGGLNDGGLEAESGGPKLSIVR